MLKYVKKTANSINNKRYWLKSYAILAVTREPCWITSPAKCDPNSPYRTIDGSCNNLQHPTWGQSIRPIGRRLPPQYNPGNSYKKTTYIFQCLSCNNHKKYWTITPTFVITLQVFVLLNLKWTPLQYKKNCWCAGSKTDIRTIGRTGRPLPSTRRVSTAIHALATEKDLSKTLTTMHMTWGQFIDHDMTHVPLTPPVSLSKMCDSNRQQSCQ